MTTTPTKRPEPFGALLGIAPGDVPAYSSDYETVSDHEYPSRSSYRSYVNGIYMGYKWQCVEFARRWMYMNCGYIFDYVAMAYDIFELRTVRDLASNSLLPLQAFRNGSKAHPVPGSLLIWSEGGEFEDTGHVAVVTEVSHSYIRIAEQNVGHGKWGVGKNYARELSATVTEEGEYWVKCSYGDAEILGWMTQTDSCEHTEPSPEKNLALTAIKSCQVDTSAVSRKSWLNMANADEAAFVDMMGGHFLTAVPKDQSRYFLLSETALDDLEHATNELHGMFMHATEYVLCHDDLLAKFNLPKAVLPKIRQSWGNRLNQLITSRFDFAQTEAGLKVYEYNCDSASCYMEAGKVQGKWGQHYQLKESEDAGRDLLKDLTRAWERSQAKGLVHILRDDDAEEKYHALFMQESLRAAGIQSKIVVRLSGLRWDDTGAIRDADDETVSWVWKTWSWETALDQIREECEADAAMAHSAYEPQWAMGKALRLSDVLLRKNIMVFEPLWTLIPSNKAILPVLWALFPNHPLLLNSGFELTPELQATGYVVKPIVGRCGANIALYDRDDRLVEATEGNFASQDMIYQQLFPLPRVGDYYTQVCTFTAAGVYAGACVRVDNSMVISKNSDCMPLRWLNDKRFLAMEPQ